jgi:hypothetical protein
MSHWYDKEGNPKYEVLGKSGVRPTTLRDARKAGWVPSVSTVWGEVVSKPMLNKWKEDELAKCIWRQAMSADNFGKQDASYEAAYKSAREVFSQEQQAIMNRGTVIHDHLESYFKGQEVDQKYMMICRNVHAKLNEICGEAPLSSWVSERSFAHPIGYGGKIDLCNEDWVVDFKTKKFVDKPSAKKMAYDDYGVQLAAYNQGIGKGRRILNLFIDIGEGNQVLEWEFEDVSRYESMFNQGLSLWKLMKQYDPSFKDQRIM